MSEEDRYLDARTSPAMRAILELEDEAPDALLEVLPETTVPFWAQVRVQIAWMLSAQETGSVEVATTSTWSRGGEAKRVARGYLPSKWDAVRRAAPHDICFYVAGGTLAADGGRARNWLVDDFAEVAGDAVVVQQRPLPSSIGRPVFRPTLSMESATARSRWRARGSTTGRTLGPRMNTLLAEYARLLGQPGAAFEGLGRRAIRSMIIRPFQLDELERMLDRMRPKVVVYDNGSYTYNGEFIGLMKDAGIYVVEPQHGWIGPSHAAYNYGRAFDRPALRRALPDELLTFGSYWSESIRHPGRVTVIGKPHLERQVADVPHEGRRQILIVSSRTAPEVTDAFVVGLRAALGEAWPVVFRPHPGERDETRNRYPMLSADSGVTIDRDPDVYESLKRSAVVIGEASTVLFEARAFGCHVIARDSAFAENVIGDAFGERVDAVAEAVARVRSIRDSGGSDASTDPRIWSPDALGAFAKWLDEHRRSASQVV